MSVKRRLGVGDGDGAGAGVGDGDGAGDGAGVGAGVGCLFSFFDLFGNGFLLVEKVSVEIERKILLNKL